MRTVARIVALLLVTTACAGAGTTSGPPEIAYGRDLCVECGMTISEVRYAAAYRIDGEPYRFDDIGGMLLHGIEHGVLGPDSTEVWVHDFETEAWVAASSAWYVAIDGLATPMGYGVVAFTDRARAEAHAAAHGGTLLEWAKLLQLPIEPGTLGHDHTTTHDTNDAGESP